MEKKISEEYGAIVHTIRKDCRFDYENDWDGMVNSLPKKEWMSEDEETFRINTLIEKQYGLFRCIEIIETGRNY